MIIFSNGDIVYCKTTQKIGIVDGVISSYSDPSSVFIRCYWEFGGYYRFDHKDNKIKDCGGFFAFEDEFILLRRGNWTKADLQRMDLQTLLNSLYADITAKILADEI